MIVIVDYGMGNLNSVLKKFAQLQVKVAISCDQDVINQADKVVLPGVGHFGSGVRMLKDKGLWDVLNTLVVVKKIPVLGICLGMQLMLSHSQEGDVEGFGWIKGNVMKFDYEDPRLKIPHMGWNTINILKSNELLDEIVVNDEFYFVHSYYVKCESRSDVLATTKYIKEFDSCINIENIFGVQFHPEKSHVVGETIFKNFIKI